MTSGQDEPEVDTVYNSSNVVTFVLYHRNAINKPLIRNGRLPSITHVGGSHTP
jgi:hypothetical protein